MCLGVHVPGTVVVVNNSHVVWRSGVDIHSIRLSGFQPGIINFSKNYPQAKLKSIYLRYGLISRGVSTSMDAL